MTSRQISLVQDSFQLVQPILEDAAILFYGRLFELDPTLASLFRTPRDHQARLLAQTLTIVVKSLDRPAQIKDAVTKAKCTEGVKKFKFMYARGSSKPSSSTVFCPK